MFIQIVFFLGGRGGSTKLHYFVPVLTASSNPQKRWRLLRTKHAPARHHTRVVCYGRECLSTSHQMVGSGTKLKTFFILTAQLQQIQSRKLLKFCTPSGIKKSRSWICVRTVCVCFLYNCPFSELPITTEQPSSRYFIFVSIDVFFVVFTSRTVMQFRECSFLFYFCLELSH